MKRGRVEYLTYNDELISADSEVLSKEIMQKLSLIFKIRGSF